MVVLVSGYIFSNINFTKFKTLLFTIPEFKISINFLLSDINKYIPKYNSLAVNEWQGHNLILVSVNPVDEVMEAKHGYSTKNVDIISFNTQITT